MAESAASAPSPAAVVAAAGDDDGPHPGSMIALYPDDPDALAVDGGDPPDELHVTLAFLAEDAADLDVGQLDAIAAAAAAGAAVRSDPLELSVVGYGTLGAADPPATVLFVQASQDDPAGAGVVYEAVREQLDAYGAEAFPPEHDAYIPHLTLGYGLPVETAAGYVGETITFSAGPAVVLTGAVTKFPWGGPDGLTADGRAAFHLPGDHDQDNHGEGSDEPPTATTEREVSALPVTGGP